MKYLNDASLTWEIDDWTDINNGALHGITCLSIRLSVQFAPNVVIIYNRDKSCVLDSEEDDLVYATAKAIRGSLLQRKESEAKEAILKALTT